MSTVPTNNRLIQLSVLALAIGTVLCSQQTSAREYKFDNRLLMGSGFGEGVDLSNYNVSQVAVPEGQQILDISLNGSKIKSQIPVTFRKEKAGDSSASPCLDESIIRLLQLKAGNLPAKGECLFLSQITKQANWNLKTSTLTLEFLIPQLLLNRQPRDFIPVSEWQAGVPVLFLRHNTSFTRNIMRDVNYNYLWSMINAGGNLGMWQLRHQANLRYMHSSYAGDDYKWNSVRTWIQRPLPSISSQLTLGDAYTDGSMFGSLAYNGVKLATDQRMWSQSKRGYAPEVRGTASTNAHVFIRQQGQIIYETQVPPGPFLINDLYNTRSQGDLQVQVVESDGQSSYFTVPYSAVPDSMRPGNFSYQFAAGKVRNYYSVQNAFTEGVLQYGINNSLTANTGARFANNYQALLLGGVWASKAGALSLNSTWSHAKVENNETRSGWRAELAYSKMLPTNTNVVLAAYRYSTSGYRDLEDVLGVRRQSKNGTEYFSDTLNQRNRLQATLSQSMQDYGTLALSASSTDYYNNRSRQTELQLSYSNMWKKLSYNFSIGRQRSTIDTSTIYSVRDSDYDTNRRQSYTENVLSFGISVPLDWRDSHTSVAFDWTKNKSSTSGMASLSGSAGNESDFTYSLYNTLERFGKTGDKRHEMRWGANVQQRTRMGTINASYARSDDYHQLGLGTAGTLAVHSGGLTYGPYTSDTFALVEAKGASGAKLQNGQGAKIDAFGYAIVPSLTPYRYNTISLDGKTIDHDVEIEGGNVRVVPVFGGVPKISFSTRGGTPVLIAVKATDGSKLPMGAEVKDRDGNVIGMVGQGGEVYARLPDASGTLFVSWGRGSQCRINYQTPAPVANNTSIARITGICI